MFKRFSFYLVAVIILGAVSCSKDSRVDPCMVLVVGGTFHNGTAFITLSNFYISKTEVTQAQYSSLMSNMPNQGNGMGDDYPVYYVSWFDAVEYCNRRSIQEGYTPVYSLDTLGTNPENWPVDWSQLDSNHVLVACDWSQDGYRLPTEMEWMYASLGGDKSKSFIYSGSNDVDEVAWYQGNNDPVGAKEVATKHANELGLYDMSGNVWEWVWDIMDLYSQEAQTNPQGAADGHYRGRRGGSWYGLGTYCRIEQRDHRAATFTSFDLGFRVARSYGYGD